MRFQFAFALSHNARLFLMDEPASGLDPLFRKNLIHCMQDIVEDGTRSVLFSTHITEELDGTASQILWLHDGEMDALENGAEIEALLTGKFLIRDLLEKYGETV